MIGLDYFLAGVHFDRNFLWLGPVLMAGGILVGLFPQYGWTGLGVVIALGLIVPTLFGFAAAAGGLSGESDTGFQPVQGAQRVRMLRAARDSS